MKIRVLSFLIIGFLAVALKAQAQDVSAQYYNHPNAPDPQTAPALNQDTVQNASDAVVNDKKDGKAFLADFSGEVRVLKKDAEDWVAAKKDMILEPGDRLITGAGSHAVLVYDNTYKNMATIEENTKVEILSIEPTMVRLEDGSIFNVLDGLDGSEDYQIATPTAVAAVRGTQFLVGYEAEAKRFMEATVKGHVAVSPVDTENIILDVLAGHQMEIMPDQKPNPEWVVPMNSETAAHTEKAMEVIQAIPKPQESGQSTDLKENLEHPGDREELKKNPGDGNPPDQGGNQGPERMEKLHQDNNLIDRIADDALLPEDSSAEKVNALPELKQPEEKMSNNSAEGGKTAPDVKKDLGLRPPRPFAAEPPKSPVFSPQDLEHLHSDIVHNIQQQDCSKPGANCQPPPLPKPPPQPPETQT